MPRPRPRWWRETNRDQVEHIGRQLPIFCTDHLWISSHLWDRMAKALVVLVIPPSTWVRAAALSAPDTTITSPAMSARADTYSTFGWVETTKLGLRPVGSCLDLGPASRLTDTLDSPARYNADKYHFTKSGTRYGFPSHENTALFCSCSSGWRFYKSTSYPWYGDAGCLANMAKDVNSITSICTIHLLYQSLGEKGVPWTHFACDDFTATYYIKSPTVRALCVKFIGKLDTTEANSCAI